MSRSIKVDIAGRQYPLSVPEKEEDSLLELVDEIKETLGRLKSAYAVKDTQDLMAMALLDIGMKKKSITDQGVEEQWEKEMLRLEDLSNDIADLASLKD